VSLASSDGARPRTGDGPEPLGGGRPEPSDPPGSTAKPPSSPALDRIVDLGAAAQAAIPGLYAWGVTVAPAAWSRGSPWSAQAAAVLGLLSLGAAPFVERWSPSMARVVSVWGLVTTSGLVWVLVPASLAPGRLDPLRGIAGMFGWGLFALATAAPALRRVDAPRGSLQSLCR